MVSPAARRAWIAWVVEAFRVPVRRACRATGVGRSLITYRRRQAPQTALWRRLQELAALRVSYGYKRLHILLRREGWRVNHKRIYRLYGEEALALRGRRPRRRKSAVPRGPRVVPTGAKRGLGDGLHAGHPRRRPVLRVLTLIDSYTRECLALVARPRFGGADVAAVLQQVRETRPLPARITMDNGTEFTSRALDAWAYWNGVQLDFSRPGKPVDNCLIEAFNGSFRRECLSQVCLNR
jgi:putative transposase